MRVVLPPVFVVNETSKYATFRKLESRRKAVTGTIASFKRGRVEGRLFQPEDGSGEVLILPKRGRANVAATHVLVSEATPVADVLDLSKTHWARHPAHRDPRTFDRKQDTTEVLASWRNAFYYVAENASDGIVGLRPPQLGALHAVLAHWSSSDETGTVVMPTGTGKTDTMLALLVAAECSRVLVVVPTDALREQVGEKFTTLGVLKADGSALLGAKTRFPNVTILEHVPPTLSELNKILEKTHVLVTTSHIASLCKPALQARIAETFPVLFIDEAHHAEAPTWKSFKSLFAKGRVVQFTATPFREDGKLLDGRIIYKYPLRKAQVEGYFKPIRFKPVTVYDEQKSDAAIAEAAVAQLRADFNKGHIVMARAGDVERARSVYPHYAKYPEFNPVELHSGIKSGTQRDAARSKIISGESRIVVCVDMLGEGFDLPELKIAAFHDVRKSLAVTLQLAGRFTRSRADLGDATFIANVADVVVQDELRKLYTRDPDWNVLLPELSEKEIGAQVSLQTFLDGFSEFPAGIPLKEVRPASSAVVYRTGVTWKPEQFRDGISGVENCKRVHHAINEQKNVLVVVTARQTRLKWTMTETIYDWIWELYVAYWSAGKKLLFINGSANAGEYGSLANAITDDPVLVKGQEVFRAFAGITRLRLQSVGLSEQLGKNVSFTNRMGSDVEPGVTQFQRQKGIKSVLAGNGFEGGERTSIGASKRGRIWSHRRERIDDFIGWCEHIGGKLVDGTIDPDVVLKGTLRAEVIRQLPNLPLIAVTWPDELFDEIESRWTLRFRGQVFGLSDVELRPSLQDQPEVLKFQVVGTGGVSATIQLELTNSDSENPNYTFTASDGEAVHLFRGDADLGQLVEYFYERPPLIWFVDGSSLEGNELVSLRNPPPPYDATKLVVWDWSGTNIQTETQGPQRDPTTVQARVIRELVATGRFVAIVDDDDTGEIADVVAIRDVVIDGQRTIELEAYHCKFSAKPEAGGRVGDLYEVCGQAQKCTLWMSNLDKRTDIFTHLLRRDEKRTNARGSSRFELGDAQTLRTLRDLSRTAAIDLKIFIVQPGLSAAKVSAEQLQLLGVTENHLSETYQIPLTVIVSG